MSTGASEAEAIKQGRPRVIIDDVAREAGVSASTASRVLRGSTRISAATRERVFAAATKVGYRPNLMARALRTGEQRGIGVVLAASEIAGNVYPDAILALKRALAPLQMQLVVSLAGEGDDPDAAIDAMLDWCGVLAVQASLVRDAARLCASGAPVILLDPLPDAESGLPAAAACAGFDVPSAAAAAVEHLVSLGHHNIAYLGGPPDTPLYAAHEQGFRAGMTAASLSVRPEWLFHCSLDDPAASAEAAFGQAINAARSRLTAWVCASDSLALGLVGAIERSISLANYIAPAQVPGDYSVVGYGNSAQGRYAFPPLTTLEHNGRDLGETVARIVSSLIESPQDEPARVVLPARLLVRDSTAPRAGHISCASVARRIFAEDHPAADTPLLADGIYELQAVHSAMMLDVPNAARIPGGQLWQWERNGTSAQLWHVSHVDGPWYTVRNIGSGFFLDADRTRPDFGPLVANPRSDQYPDFQLWSFEPLGGGNPAVRIVNKAKGLVVDIAYGSRISAGEVAMVFGWKGEANQQWLVHPVPFLTGEYELVAMHSSRALDVPNQSRVAGTVPCQASRARSLGQRWHLVHRGGSLYTIQSRLSNLNLQAWRPPKSGVTLCPDDPEAADAQLWHIQLEDPSVPVFRIVNKALQLALGFPPGQFADKTPAVASEWRNDPSQQWLIYDDSIGD